METDDLRKKRLAYYETLNSVHNAEKPKEETREQSFHNDKIRESLQQFIPQNVIPENTQDTKHHSNHYALKGITPHDSINIKHTGIQNVAHHDKTETVNHEQVSSQQSQSSNNNSPLPVPVKTSAFYFSNPEQSASASKESNNVVPTLQPSSSYSKTETAATVKVCETDETSMEGYNETVERLIRATKEELLGNKSSDDIWSTLRRVSVSESDRESVSEQDHSTYDRVKDMLHTSKQSNSVNYVPTVDYTSLGFEINTQHIVSPEQQENNNSHNVVSPTDNLYQKQNVQNYDSFNSYTNQPIYSDNEPAHQKNAENIPETQKSFNTTKVEEIFSSRQISRSVSVPNSYNQANESQEFERHKLPTAIEESLDLSDLGLSTHRPESDRDGEAKLVLETDDIDLGDTVTKELRLLLGEEKFKQFVEKSKKDIDDLQLSERSARSARKDKTPRLIKEKNVNSSRPDSAIKKKALDKTPRVMKGETSVSSRPSSAEQKTMKDKQQQNSHKMNEGTEKITTDEVKSQLQRGQRKTSTSDTDATKTNMVSRTKDSPVRRSEDFTPRVSDSEAVIGLLDQHVLSRKDRDIRQDLVSNPDYKPKQQEPKTKEDMIKAVPDLNLAELTQSESPRHKLNRPKHEPPSIYQDKLKKEANLKEKQPSPDKVFENTSSTGKNYEQTTVPRKTSFAASEIYHQAYGTLYPGPAGDMLMSPHYQHVPGNQSTQQYGVPVTPTTPSRSVPSSQPFAQPQQQFANQYGYPGQRNEDSPFIQQQQYLMRQSSYNSDTSGRPISHPQSPQLQQQFGSTYNPMYNSVATDFRGNNLSVASSQQLSTNMLPVDQSVHIPHPPEQGILYSQANMASNYPNPPPGLPPGYPQPYPGMAQPGPPMMAHPQTPTTPIPAPLSMVPTSIQQAQNQVQLQQAQLQQAQVQLQQVQTQQAQSQAQFAQTKQPEQQYQMSQPAVPLTPLTPATPAYPYQAVSMVGYQQQTVTPPFSGAPTQPFSVTPPPQAVLQQIPYFAPVLSDVEVQTDRENIEGNENATMVEQSTFTSVSQIKDEDKMIPHPPSMKKETDGRPSPRRPPKFDPNSRKSEDARRHIDGIRQHHEQRRQQQEDQDSKLTDEQILEKQRKFAKASLDRYFSSLENLYKPNLDPEIREVVSDQASSDDEDHQISEELDSEVKYQTHKENDPRKNPELKLNLGNEQEEHPKKVKHVDNRKSHVLHKDIDEKGDHTFQNESKHSGTAQDVDKVISKVVSKSFGETDSVCNTESFNLGAGINQMNSLTSSIGIELLNSNVARDIVDTDTSENALIDNTEGFDNDTIVGSEITSVSMKAGGVTERLAELGIEVSHTKHGGRSENVDSNGKNDKGKKRDEKKGKALIICPECNKFNKEYMSWCTQCGEMIIGVEPMLVSKNREGKIRTRPIKKEEHESNKEVDNNMNILKNSLNQNSGKAIEVNYVEDIHEKPFSLNLEGIKSSEKDNEVNVSRNKSPIKSEGRDSGRPSSDDPEADSPNANMNPEVVNTICKTIANTVEFVKTHFIKKSKNELDSNANGKAHVESVEPGLRQATDTRQLIYEELHSNMTSHQYPKEKYVYPQETENHRKLAIHDETSDLLNTQNVQEKIALFSKTNASSNVYDTQKSEPLKFKEPKNVFMSAEEAEHVSGNIYLENLDTPKVLQEFLNDEQEESLDYVIPPILPNFSAALPKASELSLKLPANSMDFSADYSQTESCNFDKSQNFEHKLEQDGALSEAQEQVKAEAKEERRKERRRKRGHGAIDVEVFGYDEMRDSRNSSRGLKLVPMLNLAGNSSSEGSDTQGNSSDDDDLSTQSDTKPEVKGQVETKQPMMPSESSMTSASMNAWEPALMKAPWEPETIPEEPYSERSRLDDMRSPTEVETPAVIIEQPRRENIRNENADLRFSATDQNHLHNSRLQADNIHPNNTSYVRPRDIVTNDSHKHSGINVISVENLSKSANVNVRQDMNSRSDSRSNEVAMSKNFNSRSQGVAMSRDDLSRNNHTSPQPGGSKDWQHLFDAQESPEAIPDEDDDNVEDEEDFDQPFLMQVVNHTQPAPTKSKQPKSSKGKAVKSKVRQSIEDPSYQRKWARSSTAWGSYNPGELNTSSSLRSSTDQGRPRPASARSSSVGRSRNNDNNENDLEDWRSTSPQRQAGVKKTRPASADLHRRKQQKQKSKKSSNHDSELDLELDLVSEMVEHRLPKQAMLLRLQGNMASPKSTYDKLIEMTPRIQAGTMSAWQCLPDEILLHIFAYLDQTTLTMCAQVCHQFYRVAMDESLWKYITIKKKADLDDRCLTEISKRHPVSLALIQCQGERVTAKGLRDLFRECSPTLKELNIARCSLGALHGDSLLLHAAARCNNITHIDTSWCNITDSGLMAISNCVTRLESLCFSGCQAVTNDGLETVIKKHGTHLRVLEMFGCFNISPRGLRCISNNCINLLTLNLGQVYKLTDSCIAQLSSSLGRVESLDLRGCKQIKDNCLRRVVKNCPRLKHLSLANCPNVTDVSVLEISTYLQDIRSIDLCGCKHITDSSIRALVNTCTNLRNIDISSTSCTHRSVSMIANFSGQRLETLKINFLADVTEQSLIKLAKHCHRLTSVHMYGCTSVRNLSKVKEERPSFNIEM